MFEIIFHYFFWPYTAFLLMVCGLCILFGYIIHKIKSNDDSVPFFKSKGKRLLKIFLAIELIPSAIILVLLFIFPERSQQVMWDVYWKIDHMLRALDIEGCMMHHPLFFALGMSFLMSIILLAYFLQITDAKLSIKTIALYLLISTPLICGLFYLLSSISIFTIIIIIGLLGALLSFLK